jgi:DNA polymerase-3 subunit delta
MQKLYIGKETHMSLSNAHKLLEELKENGNYDLLIINAEKSEPSKIVDILSSTSLFSQQRILFFKRLYRNTHRSEIIDFLLEHLENDQRDHIVLWEDQKVSAVTKYVKYFKSKKSLEEFNDINKRSFLKYVSDICKSNSLSIQQQYLPLLAQRSNYDLQRLENNIKKLKLLGEDIVDEKNIEKVVANTLEEDIWKLLDEMNSINGSPLLRLEQIFEQGVDPHYILPMISRNLRLITLTKDILSSGSSYSEIASKLKIPPFTVKPLITASEKYNWQMIKSKYEKLSSLDYEIKTGRIEAKLGLTLFCTIP